MKIGILTLPICNNYGGILQAYALQAFLKRHGHEVVTLNFPIEAFHYQSRLRFLLSYCRRLIKKAIGDPSIVFMSLEKEYRKRVELSFRQKQFIDKNITLLSVLSPLTEAQIDGEGFDALIVGSDQVWRPKYSGNNLYNMFLDFATDLDVKRLAYAASFGTNIWEYSQEQTEICSELIKKFKSVSVREESAIELCRDHLGIDSVRLVDPTLLLSKEDYLSLCTGKEHPSADYIAVYILDYSKERVRLMKSISERTGLPLHFVGRFTKEGYPSVESWLEGIANAKYVVTDSFHGSVFSIIFERQFVTLGNAARGNNRFDSLFKVFGIEDKRMCNDLESILKMLQTQINYFKINSLRSKEIDRTLHFFKILSTNEKS